MKSGDFVRIDYIGRVKDSGEIFDLTKEDVAKAEGIYNPQFRYKPVAMIVDANFVIAGLNNALKEMKVGERKTVDISPEKAFGERKAELIKLVPVARFKEQNVNPVPGAYVTINRLRGRIISVSGGRVKVDFNHPLAGKALQYEIEIKNKITDAAEKVKAIVSYFTGIDEKEVEVALSREVDKDVKKEVKEVEIRIKKKVDVLWAAKELIANTAMKWVSGTEKIKFVDVFESSKKSED